MSNKFRNADEAFAYVANACLNGERKNYGEFETVGVFGLSYAIDFGDKVASDTFKFPMITTRVIHWKSVLCETLFFLAGSDDNSILQRLGVNFWTPWADKNNKIPCTYGKFWRKVQTNCASDRAGCQGELDQVDDMLQLLRSNPGSRRAVVSAWQPAMFKQGALVPCHDMWHAVIGPDGRLNMSMFQRSCDTAIGLPANIASYGLIHCMLAKHLGVPRGIFFHAISDAHVYSGPSDYDHRADLENQIRRTPRLPPTLDLTLLTSTPIQSAREHEAELLHSSADELLAKYNLHSYYPNPPLKYRVVVT